MWITVKERITNCGDLKEALKTVPDDAIPEIVCFRIWKREQDEWQNQQKKE